MKKAVIKKRVNEVLPTFFKDNKCSDDSVAAVNKVAEMLPVLAAISEDLSENKTERAHKILHLITELSTSIPGFKNIMDDAEDMEYRLWGVTALDRLLISFFYDYWTIPNNPPIANSMGNSNWYILLFIAACLGVTNAKAILIIQMKFLEFMGTKYEQLFFEKREIIVTEIIDYSSSEFTLNDRSLTSILVEAQKKRNIYIRTAFDLANLSSLTEKLESEAQDDDSLLSPVASGFRFLKSQDKQDQRSVEQLPLETKQKRSMGGRKKEIWVSNAFPIVAGAHDPIAEASIRIAKIWPTVKARLLSFNYPPPCDKDGGRRREQAINAWGASIIYYAATKARIANVVKGKVLMESYPSTFDETVKPILKTSRSSVRPYWHMMSSWYDVAQNENYSDVKLQQAYHRWKENSQDKKYAVILLLNYKVLPELIELTEKLLVEEFSK